MSKQFRIEDNKYAKPKPKVKKCTYTLPIRALEKQLQQLYARRRCDVARDYKRGMSYADIAEKYSWTVPTARAACYAADGLLLELVEVYDRPMPNEDRDLIIGMEFSFTPGENVTGKQYHEVLHGFSSMSVSLEDNK